MKTTQFLEKRVNALIVLTLLVILSYSNSLFNPFMWDDKVLIVNNPGIQGGWESVKNAFSPELWGLRADNEAFQSFYRPTHTLLSIFDYQIWGLNPFGYHLSNMVLHLLNTILLYFFAYKIIGKGISAFIAASLFAVHPVHTESVTFISARPDLLSAFFLLSSFYLYIRDKEETWRRAIGPRYIFSILFFAAALFSKEMSLTLPVFIALYSYFFEEKGVRLKRVLPYFAVLIGYILFRIFAMNVFLEHHRMRADVVTLALTASTAVFDYVRLLLFPYPLRSYYTIVWQDFLNLKVFASLALLFSAGFGLLLLYIKKERKTVFALFWTFLAMAPVLNIGSLGEFSIAERYLYIPSIGFSILLAIIVTRLLSVNVLGKAVPFIWAAIIITLGALTIERNMVWGDDIRFYKDMAKGAPDSPVPHANLAHAYLRAGDVNKAIPELEEALRYAKSNFNLYNELGVLYGKTGRFDDAAKAFGTAVNLKPDFGDAYNGLGMALAELGRLEEAESAFMSAVRFLPEPGGAAANLERVRRIREGR